MKYSKITRLIDNIKGTNNYALTRAIEYHANQKLNSFYFFVASWLSISLALTIFFCISLERQASFIDYVGIVGVSAFMIAPLISTLLYGAWGSLMRPLAGPFSFCTPNNIFKAVKLYKEAKKLNIFDESKNKDLKNHDIQAFVKKLNIPVDNYTLLSNQEIKNLHKQIKQLPNLIQVQIKEKIVELLKEEKSLTIKDKNTVNLIVSNIKNISKDDIDAINIIGDFQQNLTSENDEELLEDSLVLHIKKQQQS